MRANNHTPIKQLGFVLIVLVMMFATGCGSKIIRGASPMVRMNELSHQDKNIKLKLSMRNLNGVELNIQSIDFNLTVDKIQKEIEDKSKEILH